MDYECLGEQILVKRIETDDEITKGGVYKPQVARLRSNLGEVVAVGEGRMVEGRYIPFKLKAGDRVRFSRYGGTDVSIDDENYILLHWKQIYLREKCDAHPSA